MVAIYTFMYSPHVGSVSTVNLNNKANQIKQSFLSKMWAKLIIFTNFYVCVYVAMNIIFLEGI